MNVSDRKAAFFLSGLLLFLSGCIFTPRDQDPAPFYPIPEVSRSYFVFPAESYWIYEEIGTHDIDTVHLYRSELTRKNGAIKLGYDYELFVAGYRSSLTSDSVRGFGQPSHLNRDMSSYTELMLNTPSPFPSVTFLQPMKIGDSLTYADDFALIYESMYESMKINGVAYNSVMVFRQNQMTDNQTERVYFARGVGIVRRDFFDGRIWELRNFFINN